MTITTTRRPLGSMPIIVLTSAVTFWVLGALPWIVGGMRLPISSAWPTIAPENAPLVALPFGEYEFRALITVGVLGGASAVIVGWLFTRTPVLPQVRGRAFGVLGGALALVVALTQTWWTIADHRAHTREGRAVIALLLFAALAATILGFVVGLGLIDRRPSTRLLTGAFAAAFVIGWVADLANPGGSMAAPTVSALLTLAPWIGAGLLAIALAQFGLRPLHRVFGWVIAVAMFWVVPAVFTTVNYFAVTGRAGSLSPARLREFADGGRQVFWMALTSNHPLRIPLLVAVVGAAAVSIAILPRREPLSQQ